MRMLLLAGVVALICAPDSASSQEAYDNYDYEAYDIACPGGLNTYFRGDYEPVDHAGKEWLSQWFAFSPDRPLPSKTWYYAYPDRDIISKDNTAIWKWAEIRVHCWIYRDLYVMVRHYDPIDFGGYVSALPSEPGSGGCGGEYVTEPKAYEDGSTVVTATPSAICGGGGGGGGGAGGGSNLRCYTVTIEHYYYHPDTGEVEYRYTEQYSFCEEVE